MHRRELLKSLTAIPALLRQAVRTKPASTASYRPKLHDEIIVDLKTAEAMACAYFPTQDSQGRIDGVFRVPVRMLSDEK